MPVSRTPRNVHWPTVILAVSCLAVFFSGPGQTSGVSTFVNPRIALFVARRELGHICGVGTSLGIVSAAIGPLPFGFAYDLTGDYGCAIAALLVLPVAATITMWVVKPPKRDTEYTIGS